MRTFFGAEAEGIAHMLGGGGFEVISDTSEHTGSFYAIFVVSAAVIDSITAPGISGTATGITYPEGAWLYPGPFTAITLTSGTILAYKIMT
jgi:hypothetical protein